MGTASRRSEVAGAGRRRGTDADRENGPAARSFAADAHDCIMVRIQTDLPHTSLAARSCAPMASSPRINTQLGARQTLSFEEGPVSPVHRPSACSGVKALRNTSVAKRQAAKLCYRFGPLTPSARSANLIAGDGTKNSLSRSEQKTVSATQNNHLTGKAPYKFESISLQRRVSCEPDFLDQVQQAVDREVNAAGSF